MFFSIIVPVYNVEKYIIQCVNSIKNSTFTDYEIILVDDGSKDNSPKICDNLVCDNIRVIHKENGGLSDARNVGVQAALGEYLLFVDSDDYINGEALAEIQNTININHYPDIVCLECTKFFENSNHYVNLNDGITSQINKLRNDDLFVYLSKLNKFPASACTKAINRHFFINNDLFFKKWRLSEDYEWSIRMFSCVSTVAYCGVEYYYYRQARTGSISTSAGQKNMFHILETIKEGTNLASSEQNPLKIKMIYSFIEYIYRILIMGYGSIKKKNRKNFKKELGKYSYVLGTRRDKTSVLIRYTYKILGISITSKVLRRYIGQRDKRA